METELKLSKAKNVVYCILSIVILGILLFPIYWIFVTSLKTEKEIFQIPPSFWPKILNTKSYLAQLGSGDFNMFRSFGNSMIISVGAMAISIVLAVPASYGIAKYHFKGKRAVILGFLVTQMLPVSVLLTPLFITFQKMNLYNTWWSTILSDATIGIPFSVLILKNFFATIPKEIEEAAYIDGCNKFTSFVRVLIPIAKPGVVVCGIFSFLYGWGDLAYGMTFILDQEKRPITAGIFNFIGQYGTKWSYLTAFAVVTIIPVALIFILMQKYIISGMTSGAVKG
ncbi:carbohydrate ABC transporter permease [Lachnospiraceae bacterium MD1]|uniref:Carbohydrate ABC transporter permease n=1 Tax=Variimorphobacter saccharofermentans TaxID=2755051 RepID=A0A839K3H4_9FIRM|nr:carbohydrate ABC transporter permease [Variimorphobacter saccharofermentans]MBB2183928.1 carbohydrate ABC transporter permease [Variimorphobacter saccharofermentans]